MRAMVLGQCAEKNCHFAKWRCPFRSAGQVLLRVRACGVCRTDLHIVDGELDRPKLPLVPGPPDRRRGRGRPPARRSVARLDVRRVPLLRVRPREPLRPRAVHGLRHRRRLRGVGGRRRALSAFRFRTASTTCRLAPLLCAGLIGYRSLRLAGDAERLGLYGFGAAAHIVAQVALHEGRRVFAFTREGDVEAQDVRARARRGVGGLGRAAGGARRGDHLRAGGRARPGGACARSRRAARSSARGST